VSGRFSHDRISAVDTVRGPDHMPILVTALLLVKALVT